MTNHNEINDLQLDKIFPLFQDVPTEIQEKIKEEGTLKRFYTKDIIFYKNEPLKNLHFILDGTIHIVKDDKEGKEQLVSILRKGDFFPHIGLFEKNTVTPGIAFATENTNLFLVPIEFFQKVSLKYPIILMEYSKVLSKKIMELQIRLEEKVFYDTFQQIVRRLLFLAEQYGKKADEHSITLTVSLTHEELAHLVGTTRETVSRSITKLKKLKALNINQGRWTLDLSLLKKQIN